MAGYTQSEVAEKSKEYQPLKAKEWFDRTQKIVKGDIESVWEVLMQALPLATRMNFPADLSIWRKSDFKGMRRWAILVLCGCAAGPRASNLHLELDPLTAGKNSVYGLLQVCIHLFEELSLKEKQFFLIGTVRRVLRVADIDQALESIGQPKTTVPNTKMGKFAALCYQHVLKGISIGDTAQFLVRSSVIILATFHVFEVHNIPITTSEEGPLQYILVATSDFLDDCSDTETTNRMASEENPVEFLYTEKALEDFYACNHHSYVLRVKKRGEDGNLVQVALVSLQEAKGFAAHNFDYLRHLNLAPRTGRRTRSDGATNLFNEDAIRARISSNDKLVFDEFRVNGYTKWGLWILKLLIVSDNGNRYGDFMSAYEYIREWHPVRPCCKNQEDVGKIPGGEPIRVCPGCNLYPCTLFLRKKPGDLCNYKDPLRASMPKEVLDDLSSRIRANGLGPVLRFRTYKVIAKKQAYTFRRRHASCVLFWVKATYPGGEITGYKEVIKSKRIE